MVSTRKSLRSVSVTVSLDAYMSVMWGKHRKRKRKSEPLSECMISQAALAITEARQDERRPDAIASILSLLLCNIH